MGHREPAQQSWMDIRINENETVPVIARALEFVPAMSDLIDCGLDFQCRVTGNHPFASDPDRTMPAGSLHDNGVGYLKDKHGGLEVFKGLMTQGTTWLDFAQPDVGIRQAKQAGTMNPITTRGSSCPACRTPRHCGCPLGLAL